MGYKFKQLKQQGPKYKDVQCFADLYEHSSYDLNFTNNLLNTVSKPTDIPMIFYCLQ